jgi:hypothetical protein
MKASNSIAAALVAALFAANSLAAEQTWAGRISDSLCGARHEAAAEGQDKLPDGECANACVKGGSKYVFLSGDRKYSIANQNHPDLATYAGENVKVIGELKGDAITISRIERQ